MESMQKIYDATLYVKNNYKRKHLHEIKDELKQLGLSEEQVNFMLRKYFELKNSYTQSSQWGNKHLRYLIAGCISISLGLFLFFYSILFDLHSIYIPLGFALFITAGIIFLKKGRIFLSD